MREGAAKLLQASKNSRQSMEASKGLFVSNAKIIALMKELQQRQQAGGGGKRSNRYVWCMWLAHSEIVRVIHDAYHLLAVMIFSHVMPRLRYQVQLSHPIVVEEYVTV